MSIPVEPTETLEHPKLFANIQFSVHALDEELICESLHAFGGQRADLRSNFIEKRGTGLNREYGWIFDLQRKIQIRIETLIERL